MVVALARDLRQDFYPYYPDFLSQIISFLNCKEAEVLEWSFHCLAYLFKFLWRCMVRNIGPVLSSLLPLLSSKRPKYINYFAADSFAFLARKVKDPGAFLCLILDHLAEQPEVSVYLLKASFDLIFKSVYCTFNFCSNCYEGFCRMWPTDFCLVERNQRAAPQLFPECFPCYDTVIG